MPILKGEASSAQKPHSCGTSRILLHRCLQTSGPSSQLRPTQQLKIPGIVWDQQEQTPFIQCTPETEARGCCWPLPASVPRMVRCSFLDWTEGMRRWAAAWRRGKALIPLHLGTAVAAHTWLWQHHQNLEMLQSWIQLPRLFQMPGSLSYHFQKGGLSGADGIMGTKSEHPCHKVNNRR